MYSEEETELRDLIIQNLENCGFLNKIKAELRAGVFLALEEDCNLKTKIPLFNQKFDDFITTSEGKMIVSLIREFLEFYALNFTLSVFEPETASTASCISRAELCDQLNMKSSDIDGPVMVALLKDSIEIRNRNSLNRFSNESNSSDKPIKVTSTSSETTANKVILEDLLNSEKDDNTAKLHSNLENDSGVYSAISNTKSDLKDTFNVPDILSVEDAQSSKVEDKAFASIFKEKDADTEKNNKDNMFKETNDLLSPDDDPFFDEPVPTEKTPFFTFPGSLKEKSENKLTAISQMDDSKKSSLSSLKDLPSLTANHEWAFSRDAKNILPSLDSLKSVSSSETSNEEIINLDPKENFEKKDSDIAESNEESSEKQNSEDSIEEEIEEDFSNGLDELLNSSLSIADDVTTDHTVSQVSVVEGVDHVEPCK